MLVEFSVGNFLSFNNVVTFSMVSSNIKEFKDEHTFNTNNVDLLKSSVIYGANASGKTNLFNALRFMRMFVNNSSKNSQQDEEIDVESFKLNTETKNQPSYFEIVFIKNETRYRYGFQVDKEIIHEEWLYSAKKNAEKELFYRDLDGLTLSPNFKEGKGLEDKTRENALFLSVVANFNGTISKEILKWFHDLDIVSGSSNNISRTTRSKLDNEKYKERILKFLKVADLNIEDIIVEKVKLPNLPDDVPEEVRKRLSRAFSDIIITLHKTYNPEDGMPPLVPFVAEESESQGTLKLLSLSVPIIEALEEGKILVIDELDAKFHPLITKFIIGLFNSAENNKNAQLIFNTHDTTHLNNKYFRRDQIWFAEKDKYGATDFYSLVEYKIDEDKVRKDASYSKDYIKGKYGAIPYIGDIELLFLGEKKTDGTE